MNKKILSLGLAGVLTFSGVAFADSPVTKDVSAVKVAVEMEKAARIKEIKIEDKEIKVDTKNEIKVIIPEITGLRDEKYEKELNDTIRARAEEDIKAFEEEAGKRKSDEKSELVIKYEVKSRGDLISIGLDSYKIFAGDANGENRSIFYNIDVVNNKLLSFKDAFKEGTNYKEILNKEIKAQIAKESDKYFEGEDGFTSVKENQDFYIDENGDFLVVFQQYEIAPRSTGAPEFRIGLDKLRDILVDEAINEVKIADREIKVETKQDISVIIPRVTGLSSKLYEAELNEEIERVAMKDIEAFEKEVGETSTTGKSELKINYDIKSQGRITSIVVSRYEMISGQANGTTRRDYYNIDIKNNKSLELKDLFKDGANYEDLINKEIKSQIEKDKENYFEGEEGFKSINKDQGFYLDKTGSIMIEFSMYEIAPRSTGTPVFKISNHILKDVLKEEIAKKGVQELSKIKVNDREVKLDSKMYLSEKGNLMMPLGEAAKELGYKVEWNGKTRIVTLSKGNVRAGVSLKENQYSYNKALVILEEEAKSVEGVTYVPSKFFEKVLKLETSVDGSGVLNIK